MDKMKKIVQTMLEKFGDSEEYLDNLDAELLQPRNEDILEELVKRIKCQRIVLTGKFGSKFSQYLKTRHKDLYESSSIKLFNINIIDSDEVAKLEYVKPVYVNNNEFVFINDAIYSGDTLFKITSVLHKRGYNLKQVLVAYDGSQLDGVESLYKYYENY
jgi:hypothetical protein